MAVSVNNALWQHRTDQTEECVYRALWLYLSTMLYGNIELRGRCVQSFMAVSVNNALWQHRTDQTEECVYRMAVSVNNALWQWPNWGRCVQSFMAVFVNNALWQHRTDQSEEGVYRALWLYLSTMLYDNIGLTKLRNVCTELYGCICQQCFMAT